MGLDADSEFGSIPTDVKWKDLDKTRFFVFGGIYFSLTTCLLYPLSVIKTRQMAASEYSASEVRGLRGILFTAKRIRQEFGIRGFYRGLGTVVVCALPARLLYLQTLEFLRNRGHEVLSGASYQISPAMVAGIASFGAAGVASALTQSVTVPMDVISQRLIMLKNSDKRYSNGLNLFAYIIRNEGIRGLYRGLFLSIATFVPSSAIWWSGYFACQSIIWSQDFIWNLFDQESKLYKSLSVLGVQSTSAVVAGIFSSLSTTPLDLIKVKIQTEETKLGSSNRPRFLSVAKDVIRNDGIRGLFRGALPRMINTSIW
eukprot:CAMPEP_0184698964 /NCGR_PEP_ID=MMETSP0313-20130426/5389_1 /TAXON_ID=2792 /ORGANISM="Porphyridium aerugineum, Strain SAG 1380-2" /LENGTH=313 /DNA_ID=CAMNT_0027157973 /DNA_START=185 /DNA_END=1123 /DNA_ORIENTATION=+